MEENKNMKIHNEELVQAKPEEANLRIVADQAKENAEYIEEQKKAQFYRAIRAVVGAVLRGEIASVGISNYDGRPCFYLYNNGVVTKTAYGIEDVEGVINEALGAAEETEEAEQ